MDAGVVGLGCVLGRSLVRIGLRCLKGTAPGHGKTDAKGSVSVHPIEGPGTSLKQFGECRPLLFLGQLGSPMHKS